MKGFTLVEVLVASVVLIISVSTMSLVLSNAVLTEEKVDKRAKVLWQLPFVLDDIDISLKLNDGKDSVTKSGYLLGAEYTWAAEAIKQSGPPAVIDQEIGSLIASDVTFVLWNVSLVIRSGNWQKEFELKEFSWR